MKKISLFLFVFLAAFQLAALRCGDKAAELPRLKYISGRPVKVAAARNADDLRIVTFILTRAGNTGSSVAMLSALDQMYRGKIFQTIITPDPESDAMTIVPMLKNTNVSLAVDSGRRITMQYMAGSLLYPKSFVIDRSGNIIWAGESIDLSEMLQEFFAGTFDGEKEKKLAPMLEEMQSVLREGNERKMKKLCDRIFEISPAHPGALRMRLFSLENSGRMPAAWDLLEQRITAVPAKGRLYFTAVDFISRYRYFNPKLGQILKNFDRHVKDQTLRTSLAWELLNRFQFDITALVFADRLLGSEAPAESEFRRMWYASRARVACLTGDIEGAIRFQKQCAIPGRRDPMLEYFEGAARLRSKR